MNSRKDYTETVERCIRRNLPFVLYMPPDMDEVIFFSQRPDPDNECRADLSDPDWNGFFINFFNNDEPYTAGVAYDFDLAETNAELDELEKIEALYMPADITPSLSSTSHLQHIAAVKSAVSHLKKTGGKVVLSQLAALISQLPVGEIMWQYFDLHPSTFRFLVFTPETGLWLGATPELLARCFPKEKAMVTMALAGTLPIDSDEDWDDKNLEEHKLVGSHIIITLKTLGLEVEHSGTFELPFGNVKHLCTYFEGHGQYDAAKLLYSLSPTPAVAGFPSTADAVKLINRLERHQRLCYTGFVGLKNDSEIEAYVNLRSALISPCSIGFDTPAYIYNVYAGGGIMPQSDPETEWLETQAKMSSLLGILTQSGAINVEEVKEEITWPDYVSRREFLMSNRYVQ